MTGPMGGIRVLELTLMHVGPHAGTMLGDLGAEVIKIEEPGVGDVMRSAAQARGIPVRHPSGRNLFFEGSNRNKKSIAIDLKREEGRQGVYRLVEKSDVFLTNFRQPVLRRLGMDYPTLKGYNPRLIYARASGYGPEGPDADSPAFDSAVQARSGIMEGSLTGPEAEPYSPVGIADQIGSMTTAYGILAALLARERLGIGQEVNTSILGGLISLQTISINLTSLSGQDYRHFRHNESPAPLVNSYRTADDKWLMITMGTMADAFWPRFCQALGIEELEHDPRFATRDVRDQHSQELIPILDRLFARKTREEWLRIMKDYDLVAAPVQTKREILNDPQALINKYIVSYDHPELGPVKTVGCPVRFEHTPARIERPAPKLGEHTEEVLRQIANYSDEEFQHLKGLEII